MDVDRVLELVVAYLATYALHSTLLCGLAVWVARRSGFAAPHAVERLLRAALIGGVLTAGVQFGLGFEPIGGRIDFGARAPSATPPSIASTAPTASASTLRVAEAPSPEFAFEPALRTVAAPSLEAPTVELLPLALPPPRSELAPSPAPAARAWRPSPKHALLGFWLAGVAWGLASALRDVLALRRALRWRTTLGGGPVRAALAELCAEAGVQRRVRLSIAPCTHVPLSFGLFRPEIALPPRTLEDLDPREQRAVLAHELAHLVRRDIAWLWLARAIGIVFWFQPLNRGVARELERRAEFAADRWAHGQLGSGASLASALAEIAGWLLEERRVLPAAPMARERSQLARRVEHLLDAETLHSVEPRSLSVAAPLACAVVAAWAPAFGRAETETDGAVSERTGSEETGATDALDAELDFGASAPLDVDLGAAVLFDGEREGANEEHWTPTPAPLVSGASEPRVVEGPEPRADLDPREPELAPDAAPHEIFEVAALALDLEVAALEGELRDLEREFAEGEPDVAIATELARLQARVDRLIERRGRLRDLLLVLTAELDAASAASPEDTARPANSLESSR